MPTRIEVKRKPKPAGNAAEVQFNQGGTKFGASPSLTFDGTTLSLLGDFDITDGTYSFIFKVEGNSNFGLGDTTQWQNLTTGIRNLSLGESSSADSLTSGFSNITLGYNSGAALQDAIYTVVIGESALKSSTNSSRTFALGRNSMNLVTVGSNSVCIGESSVSASTSCRDSIVVGRSAGNTSNPFNTVLIGDRNTVSVQNSQYDVNIGKDINYNCTGNSVKNVLIGDCVGRTHTGTFDGNVMIGRYANYFNNNTGTTTDNVYIGHEVAMSALGSSNIFIGYQAGYNETGSNKLIIENSNSSSPLIYGEFDNNILKINGNLGTSIRTETTTYSIARGDSIVLGNTTGSSFTVTLPTAIGYSGQQYTIKNIGNNTLTVETTSAQTIDGATSINLIQHEVIKVISDGSNFWII